MELILEKNCFLIFWEPIFSRPKAVTDEKNSLYQDREHVITYYPNARTKWLL